MVKITNEEFEMLRKLVYKNIGVYLKESKKHMINSRFQTILAKNNIDNFTDYFNQNLKNKDTKEFNEFIHKITTHHTFFYRESKHYVFLKKTILPWIRKNAKDYDVRIWSAGCSSGEEAYTLAFYLDNYFKNEKWEKEILATDISLEAIKQASNGVYLKKSIEKLPKSWIDKYFIETNGKYRVADSIKKEVIFNNFNLINNFNFKRKFHVIFCRNVMIYFDKVTREKLINKFEKNLLKGGYLIIGTTESITNLENHKLKIVSPSIYRKIR